LVIGASTAGSGVDGVAAAGSTIIGAGMVSGGAGVSAASTVAAGGAVSGGAGCAEAIFKHQPKARMATAIEADVERMAIATPIDLN
jgi:hypothetical protein